jgi:hypothetical protein
MTRMRCASSEHRRVWDSGWTRAHFDNVHGNRTNPMQFLPEYLNTSRDNQNTIYFFYSALNGQHAIVDLAKYYI